MIIIHVRCRVGRDLAKRIVRLPAVPPVDTRLYLQISSEQAAFIVTELCMHENDNEVVVWVKPDHLCRDKNLARMTKSYSGWEIEKNLIDVFIEENLKKKKKKKRS